MKSKLLVVTSLAALLATATAPFPVGAALAKSISFYCAYTGRDHQNKVRFVFGPATSFRSAACRVAMELCQSRRLKDCRLYGLFRRA